jgi:uncharacterized SAM-binding protein YcdF (DUF218 family)
LLPKRPKYTIRLSVFITATLALAYLYWQFRETILQEPISAWEMTSPADCALVLTGGPGRVRAGFDLLSNHQAKKLIISGVHSDVQIHELLPLWAVYGEINEDDVVLEKRSETTYGNAQQSLVIAEALRCRDLLLVTSRIHMPRAFRIFRDVFPTTLAIRKYAIISGRAHPLEWEILTEFFKMILYNSFLRFV